MNIQHNKLFIAIQALVLLLLGACESGSDYQSSGVTLDTQPVSVIEQMQGTLSLGSTVFLDGRNSSDPSGENLEYDWSFISKPVSSQAILINASSAVAGFVPDVPGTIFVPFLYFIISIIVIAVMHEGAHGVIARVYNMKIKSSGFALIFMLVPLKC